MLTSCVVSRQNQSRGSRGRPPACLVEAALRRNDFLVLRCVNHFWLSLGLSGTSRILSTEQTPTGPETVMCTESQKDSPTLSQGKESFSQCPDPLFSQPLLRLKSLHCREVRAHTLHAGAKHVTKILERDREGCLNLLSPPKGHGDRASHAKRPLQAVATPFPRSSSPPAPTPPPSPAWAVYNWEDQSFCPADWFSSAPRVGTAI